MHQASPLPRVLSLLLATMSWLGGATASYSAPSLEPLGLVCETEDRTLPIAQVEGETVLLRDGNSLVPAPSHAGAPWTLVGDIRAHADMLRWTPAYSIERDARFTDLRYRASVVLKRRIDLAPRPGQVTDSILVEQARTIMRVEDPFTQDWPDSPDQPTAVVAIWIVDGRVVQTQVQTTPRTNIPRDFDVTFDFALTPEQASGQPALALWRDGRFLTPTAISRHAPTQAAFHAIFFNDVPGLNAARSAGAKLDVIHPVRHFTLAHYAAECGALEVLNILLAEKPRLATALGRDGETPLLWAAQKGRTTAVASLLPHYTDSTDELKLLGPALADAVGAGHTGVVRLLAPLTEPLDAKAGDIPNPIKVLAWRRGYPDLCELIATEPPFGRPPVGAPAPNARAPTSQLTNALEALLVDHAGKGHVPMVRHLLETQHLDPDAVVDGDFALLAAARAQDAAMVRLLLEAGADPNRANAESQTPLIVAARRNQPDVVAALLASGAKPNAADSEGMTALHFAAERDEAAIVAMLLDAGADVQICSIREITPLDLALFTGATESVRLLMGRGACIGLGASYSQDLLLAAISHDIAAPVATALAQGWPYVSTFSGIWPALRVAELLDADDCAAVLRAAGAVSMPDRPLPVVEETELDAPISVLTPPEPRDPRPPDAVFPEARFRIRVLVDAQGRPLFPRVLDRGDPTVVLAVKKSALQARYSPPRRKGQPVATFVTQDILLPASRDRTFAESEIDRAPAIRQQERPFLPRAASRKDRSARVVIRCVINVFGRPEQIEVLETSGEHYTDAALLAMSEWSFYPGRFRGTPVAVRRVQTFNFDAQAAR